MRREVRPIIDARGSLHTIESRVDTQLRPREEAPGAEGLAGVVVHDDFGGTDHLDAARVALRELPSNRPDSRIDLDGHASARYLERPESLLQMQMSVGDGVRVESGGGVQVGHSATHWPVMKP